MAYKINGTTVVDNSRNVCACCVTSCCITASTRLDAPSGNTASRPGSPATGSLYFDTDEGSLLSYDGTDWAAVGGGDETAKFGISGDGTAAATSYLITKVQSDCLCCFGATATGVLPCFYTARTPLDRGFCAITSCRGGGVSFGGDGSFAITVGAFKMIPMQCTSGSNDKCYRHSTRRHGVMLNNKCSYCLEDNYFVSGMEICCYQPTSRANWCLDHLPCAQCVNMCTTHSFYRWYALYPTGSECCNGGFLTSGSTPGNMDYIVPYTSLASSLCPAYQMVNCACHLIKSVSRNYVLSNFSSCGGFWRCGGLNNYRCSASNCNCALPYNTTITCQQCSSDVFLQDVTDLGYYTKSGSCYISHTAGTCGCFRQLNIRNACSTCYKLTHRVQSVENTNGDNIFVTVGTLFTLPCITYTTACSTYNCLINKVLRVCRANGCMTLYRPFGCGCGGGANLLNPECANCHTIFGNNLNNCRINSVFYTHPNANCIRIVSSFNNFECKGTCRYMDFRFTLWNVSNIACLYAVCSGRMRVCFEGGTFCRNAMPQNIQLLAWDEASCRGFWSMAFSSTNQHCYWSNNGIGFAITKTDFANCRLCVLDGVRFCGGGCVIGQWGGGSNANCCNCRLCFVENNGDGIWPLKSGHIGMKWNTAFPAGHQSCCSGVVVRYEDWTNTSFDITDILPGGRQCLCVTYIPTPVPSGATSTINFCGYTDTMCLMPKYCCVCTTQYCLTDTCGTCVYYCLFPHGGNTTSHGYCLSTTTHGDALCWLDRVGSCCTCGSISLGGSSF